MSHAFGRVRRGLAAGTDVLPENHFLQLLVGFPPADKTYHFAVVVSIGLAATNAVPRVLPRTLPRAEVEGTIHYGIHARVGAGKYEQRLLQSKVYFPGRVVIKPEPEAHDVVRRPADEEHHHYDYGHLQRPYLGSAEEPQTGPTEPVVDTLPRATEDLCDDGRVGENDDRKRESVHHDHAEAHVGVLLGLAAEDVV